MSMDAYIHARDGTLECNVGNAVYFPMKGLDDVRLCMHTMRDVAAGEELQWDYGDDYWQTLRERPILAKNTLR